MRELKRERVGHERGLSAFMQRERADGGTSAGAATGIGDLAAKHGAQTRFDEAPRAHVLRFFLAPDELGVFWK